MLQGNNPKYKTLISAQNQDFYLASGRFFVFMGYNSLSSSNAFAVFLWFRGRYGGGERSHTVCTGEIDERFSFECAFYFLGVYCLLAGALTVHAETEMCGDDGAFPVFKLVVCFVQDFQPPFVAKHLGWFGRGIDGHILQKYL